MAVNNIYTDSYTKINRLEELARESNGTGIILDILRGNENYTLGSQNRLHEVNLEVDMKQMNHTKMLSTKVTGYRGAKTADNECKSCRDPCSGDSGKIPKVRSDLFTGFIWQIFRPAS